MTPEEIKRQEELARALATKATPPAGSPVIGTAVSSTPQVIPEGRTTPGAAAGMIGPDPNGTMSPPVDLTVKKQAGTNITTPGIAGDQTFGGGANQPIGGGGGMGGGYSTPGDAPKEIGPGGLPVEDTTGGTVPFVDDTNTDTGEGAAIIKASAKAGKQYIEANVPTMGVTAGNFTVPDKWTSSFDTMAQDMAGRAAPTMDAAQLTPEQAAFRAQQQQLASALAGQAYGTSGPSVAQLQMQQGMDAAIAAQRSAAAGASGANRALAQRGMASNIGGIQQNIAGQTALLRAQEQMNAQQQLAGVLARARESDIGVAGQQAQLTQQANAANQAAALQQQAQNDDMVNKLMLQGFSRDQAQAQLRAQQEQLTAANYQAAVSGKVGKMGQDQGMDWGALAGAGMMGVGLALSGSDKRLKKNIKSADKDIDALLGALRAQSWDYKENDQVEGLRTQGISVPNRPNVGVMAQDLRKSKAGRQLVDETEDGTLVVKTMEAIPVLLAGLARIHDRLQKLEGGGKK